MADLAWSFGGSSSCECTLIWAVLASCRCRLVLGGMCRQFGWAFADAQDQPGFLNRVLVLEKFKGRWFLKRWPQTEAIANC